MVMVLLPLTSVPAGMLTSYTSPLPRYAPLVTPRLSILVGALGAGPVQLFTTACGRAPAKLSVVAIRSVAAPGALARVNLIVTGLLTLLNTAMGKSLSAELPTVYVSGPQLLIRVSDGCMRRNLSALRKLVGCPSYSPIFQRVVWAVLKVLAMLDVVVFPAETVTELVATLNSVWYNTIVYVPGFMSGDVKEPDELATVQY